MEETKKPVLGFVLRMKVDEFTRNICHLHDQLEEMDRSKKSLEEEGINEERFNLLRDNILGELEANLKCIRDYKDHPNYYL